MDSRKIILLVGALFVAAITAFMARSLIVIEQVVGVMYVAFLIARLANLYGNQGRR